MIHQYALTINEQGPRRAHVGSVVVDSPLLDRHDGGRAHRAEQPAAYVVP